MLHRPEGAVETAGILVNIEIAQALQQFITMRGRLLEEQQQAGPQEIPGLPTVKIFGGCDSLYAPSIYLGPDACV